MIPCHLVSDLPYIRRHTRAYFRLDEIYRSSRSYMITPTCGMHTETRTCSLFYHGPSMEPPLSHPIKPVFFRHLYVIMLLIPRDISLMFGFDLDYGDRTFDGWWFHVTRFSTYHTSDAILGHISVPVEIYRFSWSCMLIPTYEIHIETMTLQ